MLGRIGSALWQRVFVAYKTTLFGLALVAADVVISTLQAEALPQWVHVVVGIVAAVLALYKGSVAKPTPVQPVT